MTPLPKRTLEWMLKVKYSYNFLTKASYEVGPKRFQSQNFSLFIVKFKKLGFSAPLRLQLFCRSFEYFCYYFSLLHIEGTF